MPPGAAGPVDRAVRALFGVSWGTARGWIASGKVRVGGELVTEASAEIPAGVTLAVDVRAPKPRNQGLSDGAVVYADAHVIVVSKPAGLNTVPYLDESGGPSARSAAHKSQGSQGEALDALVRRWLVRHAKAGPRAGAVRPNLGVVHRIDRETSGLVVFTRTWLAKQSLSLQFRRHTVYRRYIAVAHGVVGSGTHRSFLIADRGDGLRGSARGRPPPDAREAVTHIEALEALAGATLVSVRLETGRTHQIRIHASEAGHPLVGERVYIRAFTGPRIEAPRLMLHAIELGFVHPATGREMRWSVEPPEDVRRLVERLRRAR